MLSPIATEFRKMLTDDWMPTRVGVTIVNFREFLRNPERNKVYLSYIIPVVDVRTHYGPGGRNEWYIQEHLASNTSKKTLPELEKEDPAISDLILESQRISKRFNEAFTALKEHLEQDHVSETAHQMLAAMAELYKKERAHLNALGETTEVRERMVA